MVIDLGNWQLNVLEHCERGDVVGLEAALDRLPDGRETNPFVFHYKRKMPLSCAAFHGRLACVKLLVERGVAIDSLTHDGRTSLAITCTGDFRDDLFSVIQYLVEHGADVNFVDRVGCSPLMRILSKQHVSDKDDVIRALDFMFKNGADVLFANKTHTVLKYAEQQLRCGGPKAVYDFVKNYHDSKLDSMALDRLIARGNEMGYELCF